MKIKTLKLPLLIMVVGIIVAIIASILTCINKAPTITTQDFNYSVTYKLNGETQTFNGKFRCEYSRENQKLDPLERWYDGTHLGETVNDYPKGLILDKKGEYELQIIVIFDYDYLMGDCNDGDEEIIEPYLAVYDAEGVEYSEGEYLEKFDAQIISWQLPTPIENTFEFIGFSYLYELSMIVMLLVAVLTIVANVVFVKKDEAVTLGGIDKISTILNFIVGFVAIPFMTLVIYLMDMYVVGDEFIYQVDLCIPMITAFTIAASVALRRKGFAKTGLIVQFIGPALFIISSIVEAII